VTALLAGCTSLLGDFELGQPGGPADDGREGGVSPNAGSSSSDAGGEATDGRDAASAQGASDSGSDADPAREDSGANAGGGGGDAAADADSGAPPRVCAPAARRCDGNNAETCRADGSGWDRTACSAGCNAQTGACFTPCNPVQGNCGPTEFCDAPDCTTTGRCVTRPASSSPTLALACGCDGVTYWNKQHANWLGKTTRRSTYSSGQCEPATAKSCNADSGAGCGPGEYCNAMWWRRGSGCGTSRGGTPSWSQCFNKPSNVSCSTTRDENGGQTCGYVCTNDCVGYSSTQWLGAEGCGA
jgi:hypothetical protein